jgi:glutathione S-transferase
MAEREISADVLARLGIGGTGGLTLVQIPYSPFCISVRTALEAAGAPFTIHNVPIWDRRPVGELTGGDYYVVPVLVDSDRTPRVTIYESRDDGTEVARYADARFGLGLFPDALEGLHDVLVRYIEDECEDVAFRLDDAFLLPSIKDVGERTMVMRHKERKFGKGCVNQWRNQIPELMERMVDVLTPLDRRLARSPFLLGDSPAFADYALYGVLGCMTFTGDNHVPAEVPHVLRLFQNLPSLHLESRQPALV